MKTGCALKVSSGSHTPSPIVTDPEVLARPGTDTGALLRAGATTVLWVNASGGRLAIELGRALEMFPPGCTLVVEGNSALEHLDADFSVFVMGVPFSDFKPSAEQALSKADLVLVDLRWQLRGNDPASIERELAERAPGAKVICYSDAEGFEETLQKTAQMARKELE